MKRAIALIAIIAMLFVAGCQGAKKDTAETKDITKDSDTLKIGAVLSKTGNYASIGLQEEKALLMEVENMNANNGVQGKKIELIVEDDASEANNASVAISKLIDEDKVFAVIGGTSPGAAYAMKPKSQQAKVPLIVLASDTNITQPPSNTYVYRSSQTEEMQVRKALDYLYKSLLQKFAVMYEDSTYGKNGADAINKLAKGARLAVSSTQSYGANDTDMTKQLKKIMLATPKVKAIVIWGSSPGVANVLKNMKQMKIDVPVVVSQAQATRAFIELAGANAEGVVFPSGKMVVPIAAEESQAKVINAFMSDYQKKYNEAPSIYAGYAYDALHLLTEALNAAGGDVSQLNNELKKTWGYVGVSGVFMYSDKDHDGTKKLDLIITEIKNGKWELKTKLVPIAN
jgi:branched-chain amino acid transport system substrate-binding protein